ncbi:MAG: ECF-type sigma factor [Acidobacteriota bacterium]
MESRQEVTTLLRAYGRGDREAFDRLMPLVYQDLRRIAHGHLRRGPLGQTLQTTGLVHEAYLKLIDPSGLEVKDRGHFLALAARAMRQVVIQIARRKGAAKRGGGERPLPLDEERLGALALDGGSARLLTLDAALERLAERDQRLARVVECRFFAGLSEQETAEALGVSLRTAQRIWMRARAWLKEELGDAA